MCGFFDSKGAVLSQSISRQERNPITQKPNPGPMLVTEQLMPRFGSLLANGHERPDEIWEYDGERPYCNSSVFPACGQPRAGLPQFGHKCSRHDERCGTATYKSSQYGLDFKVRSACSNSPSIELVRGGVLIRKRLLAKNDVYTRACSGPWSANPFHLEKD